MSLRTTNLFDPITIGDIQLNHRVVHAPTSRSRSVDFTPTDIMLEYYKSRSSFPGSLIITESCLIGLRGGLTPFKSGLWTERQLLAWRKITDQVHENNSFISCQMFAPGRFANVELMKSMDLPLVGPSEIYHSSTQRERAIELNHHLKQLSIEEIENIQSDFVQAAENCLQVAGFDFVELHCTSGFLIEQFLSPLSNIRTDEYGGSVENRCRFLIEIIEKLITEVGAEKFGIRLAPWSTHNGMEYPNNDFTPAVEFCSYILNYLQKKKNNGVEIAYVSLVEPRVSGSSDTDPSNHSNEPLIDLYNGKIIRSGGYATNYKNVSNHNQYLTLKNDVNRNDTTLIGFSRPFTSNPDFVSRLYNDLVLDSYVRKFFYTHSVEGYLTFTDYVDDKQDSNTILDISRSELDRTGTPL